MATAAPSVDSVLAHARGERPLYTFAAATALGVILVGFAPTYFLKAFFGTPELSTLKHLHALAMMAWFGLFLVQARLVATGNIALHREMGIAGIAVAVLVVWMGLQAGLASARAGVTPIPEVPPLAFLVMPVGEMLAFALLFGAAIVLRRKSPWHKRLMLVATIAMLTPAFARWPLIATGGPPAFFGMTDLLVIGCMAYDWRRNGRVHPAFLSALALVVVIQVGRLALAGTALWMDFARWAIA